MSAARKRQDGDVHVPSDRPLERQVTAPGATWLDR
jgi:hypothetical protein